MPSNSPAKGNVSSNQTISTKKAERRGRLAFILTVREDTFLQGPENLTGPTK